jgi:hypothetical protein
VVSQLVTPVASRSTTPIANTGTFDPARPSVNPGDSVLLPISKVPSYLDAVLKALTLHIEARTSFITLRILFSLPTHLRFRGGETDRDLLDRFFLPDMLKHKYIALRFVAQDAYEKAASLRIAPAPESGRRSARVYALPRGRGGRSRTVGSGEHSGSRRGRSVLGGCCQRRRCARGG